MIATRGTAGRAVLSFAQQMSLSILGTLAATAVLAALQSEWSVRPAAPVAESGAVAALPSLTEGGKFAARAIGGNAPEPFVTLTRLPLVLPLFTAPAVPRLALDASDPVPSLEAVTPPETALPVAAAVAPARPGPHREARRSLAKSQPPHRDADRVIAMAPLPPLAPAEPEERSLWSRSKDAYQKVTSWSGTLVATLLP